MNSEKAREFFSAHYEGTLESGLREAFERRLAADPALQAEYSSFAQTCALLDEMRGVEAEVPFDLGEKIAARIDRDVFERQRNAKPSWNLLLRNLALGGIGAAAIFGALLAINRSEGPTSQASIVPTASAPIRDQIMVEKKDGDVVVKYHASGSAQVAVRSAAGETLREISLNGNGWETVLKNGQKAASLFRLEVSGRNLEVSVVVPGLERRPSPVGEGGLEQFAIAVADHYEIPVVIEARPSDQTYRWDFGEEGAMREASKVLAPTYNAELRNSGVLVIR